MDEVRNVSTFKCYDRKCKGMAIYDLDSIEFSNNKNHAIKYEDHNYGCEAEIKNLRESNLTDACIFRENGE